MTVLTNASDIFAHGNKHMATKFKYLSEKSQQVVKYIIGKQRKYKGEFFESNKTISEALGCSVRTVQSSIRKAQRLGIFQVSERYETVITSGKMRRTSNVIRLLEYVDFEVVKEVTEKVMEVVTTITRKVVESVKTVSNAVAPKRSKNAQNGSYKRVEVVPEWLGKEYVVPVLNDEEQEEFNKKRDELQKKLKDKYKKK